ncbi:tetratricopeptide repeat protein [Rugosimonospora acidiphila]|uniref:tetratricopeptide repeat protein n=1 Tax=Rugosimonospora acidiphila TaxID=556531 RepID=UPI0031E4F23A
MDLMAEYRRAGLFLEAGDPAEAARILEPVIEADPGNAGVRLQLALAYFGSAQLRRAETELRTLVERDPSDHFAHHVLGRTLERLSRPTEALPHLRLAVAMSPKSDYRDALTRVAARVGTTKRRLPDSAGW